MPTANATACTLGGLLLRPCACCCCGVRGADVACTVGTATLVGNCVLHTGSVLPLHVAVEAACVVVTSTVRSSSRKDRRAIGIVYV